MPRIISIGRWRPVYDLAQKIRALEPWRYMDETDIFAVLDPVSIKTGYISIMGNLGEHFAVSIYTGTEGLYGFQRLQELDGAPSPMDVLIVPQLMLSFEDRDILDGEDLQIIRDLEIKPRGDHAWPMIRSYRPGWVPWFLDNEEIEFLKTMLEQALIVLQDRSSLKRVRDALQNDTLLARVAKKSRGVWIWEELNQKVPKMPTSRITYMATAELLERTASLPRKKSEVYLDLQMLMAQIKEKNDDRAYFPFLLIFMDESTKLVLHFELLSAKHGWEQFLAELPVAILDGLNKIAFMPSRLLVRQPFIVDALRPLIKDLGLRFKVVEDMPEMDEFIEGYERRL